MPWRREKKARAKDKRCCSHSTEVDPVILSNCAERLPYVQQYEFSVCLSYRFAQVFAQQPAGSRTEGRKGDQLSEAVVLDSRDTQESSEKGALHARIVLKTLRTMTRKKEDPRSCFLCTERAGNLPDGRRLTLK